MDVHARHILAGSQLDAFGNALLILCIVLLLPSCAGVSAWTGVGRVAGQETRETVSLQRVGYADLQNWGNDKLSEAVPALLSACQALGKQRSGTPMGLAGRAGDWREPCEILSRMYPRDDTAVRAFLENWFRPWAVKGADGDEGLFTGYYEASLRGAWSRGGRYQTPLYARPRDLVSVDLGAFRPEWKGKRIAGKVVESQLVPYDDRAAIADGALSGRARPIMWVDDPIDAFFLEVQGSGRARMPDGKYVGVGYDGANGQAYASLGRVLLDMGELARPVTMQTIRAWLEAHRARAQEVMNQNASYVFFRILKDFGPLGAQGVPLTPRRSLAVDSSLIPLGVPLWLELKGGDGAIADPDLGGGRLMVAQDTGGAIKGAVRGDYYWGYGKEAESRAGAMQSRGRYFILLPRTVIPDE